MPVDMKAVIAEALKKMMLQKSIDKITVKALIDECHISRQTFYYHFQDIMDVMEWSIKKETQRLVEQSLKMEDMRSALRIFIAFTVEHFFILQRLMDSQRHAEFQKFMVESLENYLSQLLRYNDRALSIDYEDSRLLLRYSACGLAGVLLANGGNPDLDPDQLALRLERILSSEISEWAKT